MFKRTFLLFSLVCVAASAARAASDPMVGEWKLNSQKSRLFDEMKVTSLGANKYSFDFGAGHPEIIVPDGTDQPGLAGTTLAVSVAAPGQWKVVRKKDARIELIGIWTLSKDGNNLNDDYSEFGDGGKVTTHVIYTYERRGGGPGFDADWVSVSQQMESEFAMKVQPLESDGLSISSSGDATRNLKFDGKDYPDPGRSADSLISAQRPNARSVVVTEKYRGSVVDTREMAVSDDGNTLTITIHRTGRNEPDVLVFDRK